MLPALPTGIARKSGASPSWSTISKAAVFCPSIRYGLTELTSVIGCLAQMSRTIASARSKLPSMAITFAP